MPNKMRPCRLPLTVTFIYALTLLHQPARAAENWQGALAKMPLASHVTELNKTNCVAVMLGSFQSNQVVKALIFMPGATDEFFFFNRGRATLSSSSPTLLDAVTALTNQTFIRATFRPPMLLLHTEEDPIEPMFRVEHESVAQALKQKRFVPRALYNDRDWDYLHPILTETLDARFLPAAASSDSWHFYRHSFAAFDLNGWEALEVISLAGKTTFTVRRTMVLKKPVVLFEGDTRVRGKPRTK